MTATQTMNEMLAANEKSKRIDAWRRYRTRIKDAAAVEQLDAKQAGTLADAANAAGVEEPDIERHISAVRTHQQHTARIKQLQTEVPAADAKRKILVEKLRSLNVKANEVRAEIGQCRRPMMEQSHLTESIRRVEMKYSMIFNTEAV